MLKAKQCVVACFIVAMLGAVSVQAQSRCDSVVNVPLTKWNGDVDLLADGFCIDGFYFSRVLSDYFWMNTVPPAHVKTRFLYQDPGVIDWTALERGLTLDGVDGYIALYSASTLGFKMWIRPSADHPWQLSVRQADTNALYHVQYHIEALKSGVEVSWEIAEAWGIPEMDDDPRGLYLWDGEICMTESDPNGVCDGEATDLVEWFTDNAVYE